MNAEEYRARRAAMAAPAPRPTCQRCRKAEATCYCVALRPFTPPVQFVILQHYDEAANAIATARMAHLSMIGSRLFMDNHFDADPRVDALIAAPGVRNVLLYPAPDAVPLDSVLTADDPRPPVFWVLDAKWSRVNKLLRQSPNVRAIPMARFTPDRVSNFLVRKQPKPVCLSTIESIHLVIERYRRLHADPNRDHDGLIHAFDHMVQQQLVYVKQDNNRHFAMKQRRAERAATRSGA